MATWDTCLCWAGCPRICGLMRLCSCCGLIAAAGSDLRDLATSPCSCAGLTAVTGSDRRDLWMLGLVLDLCLIPSGCCDGAECFNTSKSSLLTCCCCCCCCSGSWVGDTDLLMLLSMDSARSLSLQIGRLTEQTLSEGVACHAAIMLDC